MSTTTCKSAQANPFVRHCMEAWNTAYDAAIDHDPNTADAPNDAAMAYREAMPPLFGVRNIRNYIACVAHGAAIGVIDVETSSKLLYAAQVAFSTRRIREPREKKLRSSSNKSETSKKEPLGAISEPQNAAPEPFPDPAPIA